MAHLWIIALALGAYLLGWVSKIQLVFVKRGDLEEALADAYAAGADQVIARARELDAQAAAAVDPSSS